MKLKKNSKFIALTVIFLSLSFFIFLHYRLFVEVSYSCDYDTIATVLNIELKEDEYSKYKELELKYIDSEKNEVIDTYKVYNDGIDEYEKLKMYDVKVGSEIKIRIEEIFYEGFLGKRHASSSVMQILLYSEQEIEDSKV